MRIKDISELSVEQLEKLQEKYNISKVQIYNKELPKGRLRPNEPNEPYDAQTYKNILEKANELVAGIPDDLSEEKKFREIYRRICENIVYDYVAAHPDKDDIEQLKYSIEMRTKCRNLENGLLKGKCVCAGYAEILRNLASLKGIECRYVSGFAKSDRGEIERDRRNNLGHAWNQVKIDGRWYNCDVTWDVANRHNDLNYLVSDEIFYISHDRDNLDCMVYECNETFSRNKLSIEEILGKITGETKKIVISEYNSIQLSDSKDESKKSRWLRIEDGADIKLAEELLFSGQLKDAVKQEYFMSFEMENGMTLQVAQSDEFKEVCELFGKTSFLKLKQFYEAEKENLKGVEIKQVEDGFEFVEIAKDDAIEPKTRLIDRDTALQFIQSYTQEYGPGNQKVNIAIDNITYENADMKFVSNIELSAQEQRNILDLYNETSKMRARENIEQQYGDELKALIPANKIGIFDKIMDRFCSIPFLKNLPVVQNYMEKKQMEEIQNKQMYDELVDEKVKMSGITMMPESKGFGQYVLTGEKLEEFNKNAEKLVASLPPKENATNNKDREEVQNEQDL